MDYISARAALATADCHAGHGPADLAMAESLLPLILVLAALHAWQSALRTRERARDLGHALCARAGVQLLDQSVALRRLRLRRLPGHGWRVWRCYGFEISSDGSDRLRGSLDLVGGEMVAYDLPLAAAAARNEASANVIELRPRPRPPQ
jgi:hypothetical protein